MSPTERIAELLTRLERHPHDETMEALAEIYASETATESDRAAIRAAASTTRKLMFGLESWGRGLSEADPDRYLRLHLAIISMSDGWPDSRDAFLMAKALIQ